MEAYREIIDGKKLADIINIPKEFLQSKIELIVLPVKAKDTGSINDDSREIVGSDDILPEVFYNPIKVSQYINIKRDEIYENE